MQVQHEEPGRKLREREVLQQTAAPGFMELVSAWDQLAQRLPEHAGAGNGAALILNALKLSFAHSAPSNSSRAREDSQRALALASQLADLSAQVHFLDVLPTFQPRLMPILTPHLHCQYFMSCSCRCVAFCQGLPLDAESIAAGIVAVAVHERQLPLRVVEDRLGPIPALLIRDILKVQKQLLQHPVLTIVCVQSQ